MLNYDTETCGLVGPIVLMQYAEDDGPITLYEPWRNPISETLDRIRYICKHVVCGYNLVYDWFHTVRFYNLLDLAGQKYGYDTVPMDRIDDIAILDGPALAHNICLKPAGALDLMLYARKTRFQELMERKPLIVKRVPVAAAAWLCDYLNKNIQFDDIFFARSKKGERWKIHPVDGEPNFRNIVLRFRTSLALKQLIRHIFKDGTIDYKDIMPARMPTEVLYAPACRPKHTETLGILWSGQWPYFMWEHVDHWRYNAQARVYAEDDIRYLVKLFDYFGKPQPNDNDSILSCLVGAARHKGYNVAIDKLSTLRDNVRVLLKETPMAPNPVKAYIGECLTPLENKILEKGTGKAVLEEIARWEGHPAAERAKKVKEARKAKKEVELYEKLLFAGRFHASFKIVGTLSFRMSGADDFNPQGIKRDAYVRECFPLADTENGYTLWGGDFDSFEVTLADAEYEDPALREQLLTGKKIHGLFGVELHPELTYEQILADKKIYSDSKSSVFAMIYGGDHNTLVKKYGIPEDIALRAFENWNRRYPVSYAKRTQVFRDFQALSQPEGIGSRVFWKEPKEYVESFLGYRRYFTLEFKVCKTLFFLANDPPDEMKKFTGKTVRRDREQTVSGATRSALFAAAFNIQSKSMRAAGNHKIQNPGAIITKDVQCAIWEVQPTGVSPWIVQPMNIHDEIMCPVKNGYEQQVAEKVRDRVEKYRKQVPLIKMDWQALRRWSDKDDKEYQKGYVKPEWMTW